MVSFLVPAFFLGLLALAIPLWVHLRNRRKTETVAFPSLMFLEKVPYRSVQRQTLRHRLLLAARILAMVVLVIAFARPFLGGAGAGTVSPAGAREVVILVDRSWSMGYGDRWREALTAAQEVVAELGPGDLASLVFFSANPTIAAESEADASVLSGILAAATLENGTTSLASGLRVARRILAESRLPRRQVVLISDFQRSGWQGDTSVELPDGTLLRPIAVSGPVSNISISDVSVRRSTSADVAGGSELQVTARLTSQGVSAGAELEARLEIDGSTAQRRTVRVPENGSTRVTFDPVPLGDEALRGTLYAGDDELPGDNRFHFVVPAGRGLRVLLLDNPAGERSDSLYIDRALRIGSAPAFAVDRTLLGGLGARDLAGYDLVVLNDPGDPDAGTLAALSNFVQRGGGLLVALGELTGQGSVSSDLLPFALGDVVDRTVELGATLAYLDTTHPALELFAASDSGDFTSTRFYRYRALEPRPTEGIIARFDDGHPALLEVDSGAGRLLVWTSTLDTFWNDFALQPVFLPFVQQVAQYGAGYREPRPWVDAGRPLSMVEIVGAASGGKVTQVVALDVQPAPERDVDGRALRLVPGFARVSWVDQESEPGSGWVAANLDRVEADLSAIDAEEVAAAVVWRGQGSVEQQDESAPDPAVLEGGQSLWWYLLIVAFVVLAVETALSNRLSPRAS